MIQIDIFCESGGMYGIGHLKRCENLVLLLKHIYPQIIFKITFHSPFSLVANQAFDLVVIDSYIASKTLYQDLANRSKVLLCLDDFSRISYPRNAFVLSPTYGTQSHKKKFYGGKDYVILHPIFSSPLPLKKPNKNHIFLTLGGSNQNHLIAQIIQAIPSSFVIHIVSPTFTSDLPNVTIYPKLTSIEICHLIDSCEFGISSSGGSLNELLSRGKKTIALCIAKNQKPQLNAYHHTPSILKIFNPYHCLDSKIKTAIQHLSSIPSLSFSYGAKLPQFFKTLLCHLLSTSDFKAFELLTLQEKIQVLHLRNQKFVRQASLNPSPITLHKHLRFIQNLKKEAFYFALFDNQKIRGVGSLELQNFRIGLYRDERFTGIGTFILNQLIDIARKFNLPIITLEVLKSNQNAINFYHKHHFSIKEEKENRWIMEKSI